MRDLIYLLGETLRRVPNYRLDTSKPWAGRAHVKAAIANHRNSFRGLADDEIDLLIRIDHSRDRGFPDDSPKTRRVMTNLLNNRFAFILPNENDWCDVHPLLRDLTAPPPPEEKPAIGFQAAP